MLLFLSALSLTVQTKGQKDGRVVSDRELTWSALSFLNLGVERASVFRA